MAERKRKIAEEQETQREAAKKQRAKEGAKTAARVDKLTERAVGALAERIKSDTTVFYQSRYGEDAATVMATDERAEPVRRRQQLEQGHSVQDNEIETSSGFISLRRNGGGPYG